MTAYLVDTNVFVYARGGEHAYRDPCRGVLQAVAEGRIVLHASVELLQEFAHLLLRRAGDRATALAEIEEVRSVCEIHDFNVEVWDSAVALLDRYPGLGVRDAVHAGTALHAGMSSIISTDHAFDDVVEVTRVDPAAAEAPWHADRT